MSAFTKRKSKYFRQQTLQNYWAVLAFWYMQVYNFKECHPRCVGKLDRCGGSQKRVVFLTTLPPIYYAGLY